MYNLPIGVIVPLREVLENGISELVEMGLTTCQINCWDASLYTLENAKKVKEIFSGKMKIACLWAGWPGPAIWNFWDGPLTSGLVPKDYRFARMEALKKGADFAALIGVKELTTHVGFIPENPATAEYVELVAAIRDVALYCKKSGINFNFETGQETPVTLKRTLEDVGLDNLGVNLDPANLLMYGKGNPIDAVQIYGRYISGVHVKDGMYPTNGRELGIETPVGEGLVNFPRLLPRLKEFDYQGPLIIEREISGPEQKRDIIKARDLLLAILKEM